MTRHIQLRSFAERSNWAKLSERTRRRLPGFAHYFNVRNPIVPILLALALLPGCAGRSPVGRQNADALAAWLDQQTFSSFETFKHTGKKPEYPPSPDGLTLGSPNVFAAIGTDPDDLTSLDIFWGDSRTLRPLAKPLTVSLRLRGRGLGQPAARDAIPLAGFPDQTLRRVTHTSIAVSDSARDDLKVTCIDFAPMAPEHNFLCRWFLVENTGDASRRLQLTFNLMAPGEWTEIDANTHQLGDKLAVLSDTSLRTGQDRIDISLGRLKPGQRASAAVLLVAADTARLKEHVAQARAALPNLLDLLDQTKADWEAWCAALPLKTGDRRLDDLLDSLLCLVRSHIGPQAIHTGSLRYPHNRAWIRDSYWVQRALLELGRTAEGTLNLDFFHRAWRQSGIASYYEIPDRSSTAYGYHGVELPHYLVLMVRDAEQMAGVDGAAYWDMVSGCLDEAAVPANGLQPMNGDETWLLAAPVRELDALLDNSWLLAASAAYGADLAARMGDAERSARYHSIASRARLAINSFLPRINQAEWFAVGCGADGSLDSSLCPGVLARGAVLGVMPATEPYLAAGLITGWYRLGYERGIRTHPRSATISGGTPGYVLYAAADCPGCTFLPELARRLPDFASATGCVWEFHDMYDPAWGGEKRRLWDSAVVLMGLVHALFETRHSDDGLTFVPKARIPTRTDGPAPSFDAEKLLRRSGPALLLHSDSPEHAARVARDLLRQRGQPVAIADFTGQPPADTSAIIISRAPPPAGWRALPRGYWVRDWSGPPQLWVRNKGHVYLDTDPLLTDALLYLAPQRAEPLPFPDADFALAARFGWLPSDQPAPAAADRSPDGHTTTEGAAEPAGAPAGRAENRAGRADRAADSSAYRFAEVSAVSRFRRAGGRLDLAGGKTTLKAAAAELTVKADPDPQRRLLHLAVTAAPSRPDPADLTVTLPPGWWLLNARDMTGKWDRLRDPVGEIRLPDGQIRLVYSFSPGDEAIYLTFDLARLELPAP